jgi:hypothetical protein
MDAFFDKFFLGIEKIAKTLDKTKIESVITSIKKIHHFGKVLKLNLIIQNKK